MLRTYFCIQPEYAAKFVCDGASCDAMCCGGWHIILDDAAKERFADSPMKEEIFAHVAYNEETDTSELKPVGRHCHFLNGDKLCALQLKFGADFLSDVCAEYPRKTHLFAKDVVTRALCLTCPLAAKLALTEKNPMKFVEVEIESTRENYFQKVDAGDNTELFTELQKKCILFLQDRDLPISERMKNLGEYLCQMGGDETVALPKTAERLAYAENLFRYLTREAEDDDEATAEFSEVAQAVMDAPQASYAAYEEKYLKPYGYMIENYLVNEFFIEMYPCAMPGSFWRNFLVFDALFALLELYLAALAVKAGHEPTAEDIFAAVRWLSVRTNHFLGYIDLIGNSVDKNFFLDTGQENIL